MSDNERLLYLWSEYKYRHELVWNVLFKITFSAVLFSYLPYIPYHNTSLVRAFGAITLVLPLLATVIAWFGMRVAKSELALFKRVLIPYHRAQDQLLSQYFKDIFPEQVGSFSFNEKTDRFFQSVRMFLGWLFLLSIINTLYLGCGIIKLPLTAQHTQQIGQHATTCGIFDFCLP